MDKNSKDFYIQATSLAFEIPTINETLDTALASSIGANRYTHATSLIRSILKGRGVENLTPLEKVTLFSYLYKFNHLITRIVELHTKIPLSSIRLQKPSEVSSQICKDYIYYKFEKLFNSSTFQQALYMVVRDYWVYGVGAILIQDDYPFDGEVWVDEDSIEKLVKPSVNKKTLRQIEKIEEKYANTPKEVSFQERMEVIKHYFTPINSKVSIKGIKRVPPSVVYTRGQNEDIDYAWYLIHKNRHLLNSIEKLIKKYAFSLQEGELIRILKKAGFSEAIIRAHLKNRNVATYEATNNPFNPDGMYVASLERDFGEDIDSSLLNAVLEPALYMMKGIQFNYKRLDASVKKILMIITEDLPEEKANALISEISQGVQEDGGRAIVANIGKADLVELDFMVKDKIEIQEFIEELEKSITTALGTPSSLVGGEDTYGSQFLKIELLSNEYVMFRNVIKRFIEEKIFKPLAIKWGFVTLNEWGDVIPIYPKVRFDKISLARSSEDFQLLMELVRDGKLPVKYLLETLGFDYEEVASYLLKEKTSIFNESFVSGIISDASGEISAQLASNPDFIKRIAQELNLPIQPKEEDDEKEKEKEPPTP